MTSVTSVEEQQLLADTRRRRRARMTLREVLTEWLFAAGFLAAVAALWLLRPPHDLDLTTGALCVVILVLASRVVFETQFGFTMASQLAFVPLLFALPVAVVPLAFMLSLAIGRLIDVVRGTHPPHSLLRVLGNSWWAVFPCLAFALWGTPPRHAGPVLLVVAFAAQFGGDFASSALHIGLARGATLRSHFADSWVYVIDAALSAIGLVVAEEMHVAWYAALAVVPLLGVMAMFAREREGRLANVLELNDTYRGTALLLGDVIAADDDYTGEHSRDVVDLARTVGERLGLDAERRRNLEFAALLHDVGKIAIPKEIINKPGKLDPEEWAIMKTHSAEGERMLNRVGGFMCDVGRIVRSHHERWDGGGYPDGLVGDLIPLEARIITACDSWNAMRTDRSYRRALSLDDALTEMVRNAGTQFDAQVVKALLEVVAADAPRGRGPAEAAPEAPAQPRARLPLPRPVVRERELVSGAGA